MSRHPLVDHLVSTAQRNDRATLAILRRSSPTSSDAFPHVLPWIPEDDRRGRREDLYFHLAALFAIHPVHAQIGNFGRSMWLIAHDGGGKDPNSSAELRFRRLLEAEQDDLADLLRQAIRLASTRTRPVAVDYDMLLRDILAWDHPDRWVQRSWANAYWTPRDLNPDLTGE